MCIIMEEVQTIVALGAGSIIKRAEPDGLSGVRM